MTTSSPDGELARDALLSLLGTHQVQIEELLRLLIAKGVVSEPEWDAAMTMRLVEEPWSTEELARRCMNPEDGAALDGFFGT
jgi:hypothetical protein